MFGKGSARAWLQGLTAEAASRQPDEDLGESDQGLEGYLETAPFAVRAGLGEFLVGEGIGSIEALHEALGSSTPGCLPQILERGRERLISGAYSYLRATCERAGGLKELSPPAAHVAKPPNASSREAQVDAAGDELPDFKRLRSLLDSAEFGEPLPRALPSKSLLDSCDTAASEKGPHPAQEIENVSGARAFATAVKERFKAGWAELLTGRSTPADILNALFTMAETALDKRQPIAER